jgi:Zn-finger nucleic acid-binding protein
MPERPLRLGDVIEDYCPRCRLLLNHDIAALTNGEIAKVTCRTCYNTHDFRNAQVPKKRPRKDDKKSLVDQVLASLPVPPGAAAAAPPPAPPPVRKKRDLWAEVERIKKSGK